MTPPVFFAVAALALASPLLAQTPVYSLPGETGGTFNYLTISQEIEYADSAHLAGTNRFLDDAVVTVYSNIARQATVTLSFYGAVPEEINYENPLGQPGVVPGELAGFRPDDAPLWSSGPVVVQIQGDGENHLNLNQLVFSDINTLVPDDIFWSIRFENISDYRNGGAFGPKLENAADLSPTGAETDPSRFYARGAFSQNVWSPIWLTSVGPPTSTLSLQLTASPVPEPSTALLAALAATGLLRRRRA